MNNYWPEGEDLDLLSYEAAFTDAYEAAFTDAYEAAFTDAYEAVAFGDDSEATRRRRPRRARSRPSRFRLGRRTRLSRPGRRGYSPQTPATVQNIDDYGGDIDDYDVGGLDDDYDGGEDDYDGGEDDYAELAEGLRRVLQEDYEDAPPEEMEEALVSILETMTPAEGFSFEKALRQVASTALPQAGAIIGTALGGPGVGTAVGGKLGQVAGQALSGRGKPSSAPTPANMATASPKDGSAAAAKLVVATELPVVKQLMTALAFDGHGRQSIPISKDGKVSGAQVVDFLNTLIGQVAQHAEELFGETDERLPYYMLDSEGTCRVDLADPVARADALYQALIDAENQRLADEAALYSAYLEFDAASDGDEYDEEALDDFLY